ncbi:hypothetical protein, partial [Seonamhaeicola aphaedonensis]|uniref:hypothetical protein n=1 Tax=Seonamhaeicola aphaedonensis TaxID=1461338 RepID=UPI001C6EED82
IRDYKEELFSNYCSRIYYLFILKAELRLTLSYLQAHPTAQSSTFHFARASQNKKSLPFPNA